MLIRDFLFTEAVVGRPVEILRVGTFTDSAGREVEITEALLDALVANFAAGAAGQEVPFDIDHEQAEAAGWLKRLWRDGETLMGEAEWNDVGKQLVGDKVYRYLSAMIDMTKQVLKSVSLVNFPAVKGLSPVELAEGVYTWEQGTITLSAYLQARIHQDFTRVADAMAMAGVVTVEERKALSGAIGDGLGAFAEALGDVGEKVVQALDYSPNWYSEGKALEQGERTGRPRSEETTLLKEEEDMDKAEEAKLREKIRAEERVRVEAELAEQRAREVKLRERIRAEERTRLEAEYARRQEIEAFAAEVCGGEHALSESPEEVIAFLMALPDEQVEKAKALLRAKTVDLSEVGSSGKGAREGQLITLDGYVQQQLRVWLDEGLGTVDAFFEENAEELGEAAQYDLAAFVEKE